MLKNAGSRWLKRAGADTRAKDDFKGCVDRLNRRSVKGWVYECDSEQPVRVRVVLDGRTLVEGDADQARPDVAEHMDTSGRHGFSLTFEELEGGSLPRVEVHLEGEHRCDTLPVPQKAIQRRPARYQDFSADGEGSSRSHDKLALLKLEDLGEGDKPLAGKSVLDLGCNEGFFCIKALESGASRVVGMDKVKRHIESARSRCPEATFIHDSWWSIPDERFDVILLLSSIHYEQNQRRLLDKLKGHLNPEGTLILECGVAHDPGVRAWHTVERGDGVYRYPTRDLLIHDLLRDYSLRCVGRSAQQKGDPVPRSVYHCTPRQPTAILVTGQTRAGKSNLSFDLIKRDIPTFTTDTLLSRMVNTQRYSWSPLAEAISKQFKGKKGGSLHLGNVGNYIVKQDLSSELAEIIAAEVPVEADLFCIQGEVLMHPEVLNAVVDRLQEGGIRAWVMRPAAECLDSQ